MKSAPPLRTWQRLIALLVTLAVVLGSAPRELVARVGAGVVGMAPAPLPELRAAPPFVPLVPQELGEAPGMLARPAPTRPWDAGRPARPTGGHPPDAFALGGARLLDGG